MQLKIHMIKLKLDLKNDKQNTLLQMQQNDMCPQHTSPLMT